MVQIVALVPKMVFLVLFGEFCSGARKAVLGSNFRLLHPELAIDKNRIVWEMDRHFLRTRRILWKLGFQQVRGSTQNATCVLKESRVFWNPSFLFVVSELDSKNRNYWPSLELQICQKNNALWGSSETPLLKWFCEKSYEHSVHCDCFKRDQQTVLILNHFW